MPNTVITVAQGRHFNTPYEVASTAVAADATAEFVMNDKDWKYTVLITTTAATNVTFKAPTSAGPFNADDTVFALEANKTYAITIESGKFKNVDATNYNKVVLTTNKAIAVQIVKLP